MPGILYPKAGQFVAVGTTVSMRVGVPADCACRLVLEDTGETVPPENIPWTVPTIEGCAIAEVRTPNLVLFDDAPVTFGGQNLALGSTRLYGQWVYALEFRSYFPQFASQEQYPGDTVNLWMAYAGRFLNHSMWCEQLPDAARLLVAHNLALLGPANAPASGASASGPVTSKSVDKVSVAFNPGLSSDAGAGFFNATRYGQMLYQMARMRSLGGFYVGGMPNIRRIYGQVGHP